MRTPTHVILLMTDQHRGDCLSCTGHPVVQTPHLDGLAADGVTYTSAYSAVPSCVPARAILMTGQTAWHTGCLGMGEGQNAMRSDYAHTLPGVMAEHGYHTQLVGKMHFHPMRALNGFHATVLDEHGPGSDYERYFAEHAPAGVHMRDHLRDWNSMACRPFNLPEHLHATNWTAREAIQFMERRDPTKPFFLCNSYIRPHSPYDPPPFYWDAYAEMELAPPVAGDWAARHEVPGDAGAIDAWRGRRSERETRQAQIGYYASISHVDNQIGNVLNYLKEKGLYDDSLIIFTSDHGDMLGDHHLWRKTYAYEGSTRIPFIVKYPKHLGIAGGARSAQPVELRDVMATILDVCDLPIPPTVDGASVLAAVQGQAWRDYIHGEHCTCYHQDEEMQYVTDGREKYIWFPRTGREQFFDLRTDPGECHDRMDDPACAERIALWRSRLTDELAERPGLVVDGRLQTQVQPMVSPYADRPRTAADVAPVPSSQVSP